ncbi:MAG: TonB-dependent receptor domain-containing protein, partial [Candidatus Acidiferrales bacterium]
EYGRAAGGVVNAITKSGANTLHGQAFWYDRSSDWGAINPFQLHRVTPASPLTPFLPEDKRHQFGGALGGRIIKDKLFWFFSADQQLRPFPGVANSGTPGAIFAPLSAAETTSLTTRGVLPGSAAAVNSAIALMSNLTGNVPRRGDQLALLPKIDWVINSKNHASFSYNRFRWNSPAGIQTAAVVNRGIESFGGDFVKDDWGIAKLVSVITPNLTNEFRYQYGRDFEFEDGQPSIPGEPVSQLGVSAQVTVNGVGNWVFGTPNFLTRPKYPDERRNQFADTMSWNHGAHLFKFGFDINHVHDTEINLFSGFGAFTYTNRVDYFSDFAAAATGHAQFCTAVVNLVNVPAPCYSGFVQGFGTPGFNFSTNDVAFFVQDDWRIKPRLTLNLGLRWDSEFLPSPQIPNPAIPGTSSFASDRSDFGPRLGFAWDMTGGGKTILRGGYGIFYGRIINSTIFNAIANTGLSAGQNTVSLLPGQAGAPIYPNIIGAGAAPPGLSIIQFGKDSKLPLVHEFDLEVERQIATNTVVSISYIGSLGRRLPRFVDRNLAAPTLTTTYTVSGGPLNGQKFAVPYFGVPTATKVGTGRPNTTVGAITDISYAVNSNYNALVIAVNRRFYKNLQWQSSFTWSRANDFGQASQTFTATNNVLNPFDLNAEYSRSNFDVRDRFASGLIWTPDYYKGDKTILKYLLTGYTISPLISIASGAPYTPTISGNAPNPAGFAAVTGGGGVLADGGTNRPPFLGPNSFQMPGYRDVDLRLQKSFPIWETWKLSLIGDAFNLFNHNNVTAVSTQMFSISGSNLVFQDGLNGRSLFGNPTASSNTLTAQRQIQVGIKLDF